MTVRVRRKRAISVPRRMTGMLGIDGGGRTLLVISNIGRSSSHHQML